MKIIKVILNRVVLIAFCFFIQIFLVLGIINNFSDSTLIFEIIFRLISFFLVLVSVRYSDHLTKDIPMIILLLLSPVVGGIFMIIVRLSILRNKKFRKLINIEKNTKNYLLQDKEIMNSVKDKSFYNQMHYIESNNYPIYNNSFFRYYSLGEKVFTEMLSEMKKAKKFIFIEYFIISDGYMWNSMLEIMKEKAKEGVDVRVIYDDIGSISSLPSHYKNYLEKYNIKCEVFNRLNPLFSMILNHRDHRKMLIIDGNTAFSGGINIGDEYINKKKRFGVWKDNGTMIKGDAVFTYTMLFLRTWNTFSKDVLNYDDYRPTEKLKKTKGLISPYGTNPYLKELFGENIYLNIINNAKNYLYIFTPYLIIDSDMTTALELAAKRGVDVRIVTPGIPDKKMIFSITRSYYDKLILSGVKIYEYTPGFMHSKVFISDDVVSTVGTVNMDYRSLYLHFECGLYLYEVEEIKEIKKDVLETIKLSKQINLEELKGSFSSYLWQLFLRLIAPLL